MDHQQQQLPLGSINKDVRGLITRALLLAYLLLGPPASRLLLQGLSPVPQQPEASPSSLVCWGLMLLAGRSAWSGSGWRWTLLTRRRGQQAVGPRYTPAGTLHRGPSNMQQHTSSSQYQIWCSSKVALCNTCLPCRFTSGGRSPTIFQLADAAVASGLCDRSWSRRNAMSSGGPLCCCLSVQG
jgi:hypothetical protein